MNCTLSQSDGTWMALRQNSCEVESLRAAQWQNSRLCRHARVAGLRRALREKDPCSRPGLQTVGWMRLERVEEVRVVVAPFEGLRGQPRNPTTHNKINLKKCWTVGFRKKYISPNILNPFPWTQDTQNSNLDNLFVVCVVDFSLLEQFGRFVFDQVSVFLPYLGQAVFCRIFQVNIVDGCR